MRVTPAGVELRVKVVPGARRSEVVGVLGDRLKVRVAAPPEGGKANRALVELLSGMLGIREIEILSGHGAAEKTLRIETLTPEQLSRLPR